MFSFEPMKFLSPPINSLEAVFPGKGKRAKEILWMSRRELEQLPAGAARVRECYHPPSTRDLRMECLNELLETHGVEAFETEKGWCYYLNVGDPYVTTVLKFNGHYRLCCWGDIAERYAV
jgi:hypothetical protein